MLHSKQAAVPFHNVAPQEALEVAQYVRDMTAKLEAMAVAARLDLLAYFLSMVKAEGDLFIRGNAQADGSRVESGEIGPVDPEADSDNGPVEIQLGSDSFDILATLRYAGNLPSLPDARPKKIMVEEQSFVSGLSGYLSGLHADRIERSAKGEECEIRVLFQM